MQHIGTGQTLPNSTHTDMGVFYILVRLFGTVIHDRTQRRVYGCVFVHPHRPLFAGGKHNFLQGTPNPVLVEAVLSED